MSRKTLARIDLINETLYFVETTRDKVSSFEVFSIEDEIGKVLICDSKNFIEAHVAFLTELMKTSVEIVSCASVKDFEEFTPKSEYYLTSMSYSLRELKNKLE